MFDALRSRLAVVATLPSAIATAAAPRIEAKLRADSTTKRGNVPSYGKFGDVPSTATASGDAVVVRTVDWVMRKAVELDEPDTWVAIVADEARKSVEGAGK